MPVNKQNINTKNIMLTFHRMGIFDVSSHKLISISIDYNILSIKKEYILINVKTVNAKCNISRKHCPA